MSFTGIDPAFLLPDEVWEQIKVAIPLEPPKPKGERPRMDDHKALNAPFSICCERGGAIAEWRDSAPTGLTSQCWFDLGFSDC